MYEFDKSDVVPRPKVTPKVVLALDVKNCMDAIIKYVAVFDGELMVSFKESIK